MSSPASKPSPSPPAADPVSIRRLRSSDSIPEITRVLHRAYAGQVEMGLRPLAGRQDDETTRRRCHSGECYVAVVDAVGGAVGGAVEKIAGVILFHEVEPDQGPPWFQNKFVDSFSQFAVDPLIQGRGIGILMLETVERRAKECGAEELACSMAEPDTRLLNFYLKRGYRFVEHWQWPYTNYKSAILSKTL